MTSIWVRVCEIRIQIAGQIVTRTTDPVFKRISSPTYHLVSSRAHVRVYDRARNRTFKEINRK